LEFYEREGQGKNFPFIELQRLRHPDSIDCAAL
jgi:hypothetical protein